MHHVFTMRRSLQASVLVLSVLACPAVASKSVQAEIKKLMEAIGWPEMIRISLQRGDLQRPAKARLPAPDKAACIDGKYTQQRVLSEIAAGYAGLYTDPAIVSETTRFMSSPGAKRMLAAVASRAPAMGASAAHEKTRDSSLNSLTPDEKKRFDKFFSSAAGKAYIDVRAKQTQLHQQRLARLTDEVVEQCR